MLEPKLLLGGRGSGRRMSLSSGLGASSLSGWLHPTPSARSPFEHKHLVGGLSNMPDHTGALDEHWADRATCAEVYPATSHVMSDGARLARRSPWRCQAGMVDKLKRTGMCLISSSLGIFFFTSSRPFSTRLM